MNKTAKDKFTGLFLGSFAAFGLMAFILFQSSIKNNVEATFSIADKNRRQNDRIRETQRKLIKMLEQLGAEEPK